MPAVPTMANCCTCDYTVRGCTIQVGLPFVGEPTPDHYIQDCAPSVFGDHPCTPNPFLCFVKVPERRFLKMRVRITEYDPTDGVTVFVEETWEWSRYYGDLQHHKIEDGCSGPCPGEGYTDCVGVRYEFTLDDDNACTVYGPVDVTGTRCGPLATWNGGGDPCEGSGWNEDYTYNATTYGDCTGVAFWHKEETWLEEPWTREDCESIAISLAQSFEPPPTLPHNEYVRRVKLSGYYPHASVTTDACSRTFYEDDNTGEIVAFGRWDLADLQTLQPAVGDVAACPRVNKLRAGYVRGAKGANLAASMDSYPARIYLAADTYTGLKRAMPTGPVPFDCALSPSVGFWGWIRMKNTLIAGIPLDVYRHQCCADWLAYRRWPSGTWRVNPAPPDVPCLAAVDNCSYADVALGQLEHDKFTPIVQEWFDEGCAEMGDKRCEAEITGREVWTFPVPGPYEVWGIGPDSCFTDAGATCASGSTACSGDTALADGSCPAAIHCVPNTLPALCPGMGNITFHDSCAS